ncbi:SGNH/GDSL hydrolase family protein [Conexibacter woesei]|uniref:SGNH hydrolase-type esterase domain-containing protein n=1 Tax=Conexibacter woesei (strain DSM 14684 / CCUG 47730 / CIP 108061 / JCM 11494 / NBRC 100937 / ID131577) TaxID=469383 RepID=D3F5X5_CONWI|nr:hypothetical protein [Conexibacter woesei]ADB52674.1 hypothetical protein Cwoe_4260 [Conexibacter woesei DSM 14684]
MRAAFAALVVVGAVGVSAGAAQADGPGVGTPWVATLGDSYISGEAGRWAGNTNGSSANHDAGGARTYFDNATRTAEAIVRCHRSTAAEAHIGGGVNSVNLACSGARTATFTDSDGNFKPGLDFYNSGGNEGQALRLQRFAAANNVKLVAISIGGNNFNFASIIQTCLTDWLTSPWWAQNHCNDDASVTANFTPANVTAQTTAIRTAILNVRSAMSTAGYADGDYRIVVQDYESPVPNGAGFRYGESGLTRQNTGGCGMWNADANWANATALPTISAAVHNAATGTGLTNVLHMYLSRAFDGRRLCENTVGLLEERGLANWRAAGAVDNTEWVNAIRTLTTIGSDYYIQESLHPNWWGQLALRNCLRQAYNAGAPRGGTCTRGANGLTGAGEPVMTLR